MVIIKGHKKNIDFLNVIIVLHFWWAVLFLFSCSDNACKIGDLSFDGCWSLYCEDIYMEFCKDGNQFDLFTEPVFQTSFDEFDINNHECIASILLDGEIGYQFKVEFVEKNIISTIHLETGKKVVFNKIDSPNYSIELMKKHKGDFWNIYHEGFQKRMLNFYTGE